MANSSSKDQPVQSPPPAQDPIPVMLVPDALTPPPSAQRLDEVPWEGGGGRFIVNGQLVNHDGQPINNDGSLKKTGA